MDSFITHLYGGTFPIAIKDEAFSFSDIEIYVPTRRAARALRESFMAKIQSSYLLPRIIPFSDITYNPALFSAEELKHTSKPVISPTERLLLLAKQIYVWRQKQNYGSSFTRFADAVWLAYDLAALLDKSYLHKVSWNNLDKIYEEISPELSEWWKVSYDFLKIVMQFWPDILKERGQLDIGEASALKYDYITKQIQKEQKEGIYIPRIILGTTAAVPCVTEFVKVVAQQKNSAVILPNLDNYLSDKAWNSFNRTDDMTLCSQAQYNYFKLLKSLKISREDVTFIGDVPEALQHRARYIAYACVPASASSEWHNIEKKNLSEAFDNVALIEAKDEREEALAIAIALRAAVEEKGKTAALVTADRMVARRVSAELSRFGIIANDSAQRPFSGLLLGNWLELILLTLDTNDIYAFLGLLRHPFTRLGLNKEELNKKIDEYERFRLRGAVLRFSILNIIELESTMAKSWCDSDIIHEGYNEDVKNSIEDLVQRIAYAIDPLKVMLQKSRVNLKDAFKALLESIERFGKNQDDTVEELSVKEGIDELLHISQEIIDSDIEIDINSDGFVEVFSALMAGVSIEAPQATSNIHIWGMIEARLQYVDTVVIAGLNERILPSVPDGSPFMSRQTMAHVGLEPPEDQVGAFALEFQYLMGLPNVILTRSSLVDGIAQVPSRWLQRLQSVIGEEQSILMSQRGDVYLEYAMNIDNVIGKQSCPQPMVKPPVNIRPKLFTVTEIKALRKAPYAIYAKKILKIKPLKELVKNPDDRYKGIFYHDIVRCFADNKPKDPLQYDAKLNAIVDAMVKDYDLPEDIGFLWKVNFNNIKPAYLEYEKDSRGVTYVEVDSDKVNIGKYGAQILGRADRIEEYEKDGKVVASIYDYKTTTLPTQKSVANFLEPQLLLEAKLWLEGAFNSSVGSREIGGVYYISLNPSAAAFCVSAIPSKSELSQLIDECWQETSALIDSYYDENKAYITYTDPIDKDTLKYNVYHHLSRYDEWSR